MKKLLSFIVMVMSWVAFSVSTEAQAKLKVVTTLSTFADLVRTVGGEHVDVAYIAPPRFNPHFIEPKPSDVLKVKRADLFVHAGLDLELWRWPLVDAAANAEVRPGGNRELDLSMGIKLLEVPTQALTRAAGDIHIYGNPHYWIHPENAKIMGQTICDKLCAVDPQHCEEYRQNLKDFQNRLDQKISEWKTGFTPYQGQELVGYHNQWPYLVEFLGLKMDYFLEPKPGIPPTPKQIELVEQKIREIGIRAIIQATFLPKEASEAVAKRTGSKVVLLCENVGELPEASDYISMMDYNIRELVRSLE